MIELIIGASLAASAGFNAWMPLFLLGLADRMIPAVELPEGWSWLSGDIGLYTIGALLLLEIIADKIPAWDSVNDAIQSVLRPAAGGIAFGAGTGTQTIAVSDPATFFTDSNWISIALGVVIALVVHIAKAATRVAANAATGGIAAPVISTAEDGFSFALAATAILLPIIAAVLLSGLIVFIIVAIRRFSRRRRVRNRSAPVE